MARPHSVAQDAALDAATGLSWRDGFVSTLARDVGAAMGLGLPGVYNAFGDKHALSARCLDGSIRVQLERLFGGDLLQRTGFEAKFLP